MVLVVGGTPDVAAAVDAAAVAAQVLVTRCALEDVTTVAAEVRPLVMVMSQEIFLFDPDSFRALARDVHSRLLTVREGPIHVGTLEGQLKALMLEADDFGPNPDGEPGQR
jgi:hypothetical protein